MITLYVSILFDLVFLFVFHFSLLGLGAGSLTVVSLDCFWCDHTDLTNAAAAGVTLLENSPHFFWSTAGPDPLHSLGACLESSTALVNRKAGKGRRGKIRCSGSKKWPIVLINESSVARKALS